MPDAKWHLANRVLFVLILIINSYIILNPLLPRASYWWQNNHSHRAADLTLKLQSPTPPTDNANTLIIPKMMLETAVIEGPMAKAQANLAKGAWRLPIGSDPSKGGNTIIAAHRFSYTGPHGLFYYLDKLQVGDDIGFRWHGTMHHYSVVSSKVVPATAVSIQQPTDDERLTLYTCTPLWNPVNRLVIVAKPISGSKP